MWTCAPTVLAARAGAYLKKSKASDYMSESDVPFTAREALLFHSQGRPGKIEIVATKPMATQRDLSLAYSPGAGAGDRRRSGDGL